MRPGARVAALALFVLLVGPWTPASAGGEADQQEVEYLGPGAVAGPTAFLGAPEAPDACALAPCVQGMPSVGPLAVLPPSTFEITLRIHDELAGQRVWGALCLSAIRDGLCTATDTIIGPVCGPFRAAFLPPPDEVLVYAVAVPEDASCSDPTKGTARIEHKTQPAST